MLRICEIYLLYNTLTTQYRRIVDSIILLYLTLHFNFDDSLKYIFSQATLKWLAKWTVFALAIWHQVCLLEIHKRAKAGRLPSDSSCTRWFIIGYWSPREEFMIIKVSKGWEMAFDGGSKSPARENQEDTQNNKAWIGFVFVTPNDAVLPYSFALEKGCSNNIVEYETMITGLELELQIPLTNLIIIYGDSKLVMK